MIRGVDNKGAAFIGITRRELEGLLAGKRCCFPGGLPETGNGPHICLWFAETDADLIARMPEMYPDGPMPPIKDYRTAASPEDATSSAVRKYNEWTPERLGELRRYVEAEGRAFELDEVRALIDELDRRRRLVGRWLVLMLNDMRSAKSETVRPVARARTREGLQRLLERERCEQYREPRHELEQGSGDWVKSYRRGGPLEWKNEPVYFGGVVEAWVVTDAPAGAQIITEAQANEIPTVDELGELYGATARAEVGKHG